jgi:hypothetical protein
VSPIVGIQWWVPIPWILGLVAVFIAGFAYRRTHLPSVRLVFVSSAGLAHAPDWGNVWHITLKLLSTGADLYGLQVFLEIHYKRGQDRTNWPDVLALHFYPVAELTSPLKKGQDAQFVLTDTHLKEALRLNSGYYCLPTELPSRRVFISVYGAGDRLITRLPARKFRKELEAFCSASIDAVRRGAAKEGWSSDYRQPMKVEDVWK